MEQSSDAPDSQPALRSAVLGIETATAVCSAGLVVDETDWVRSVSGGRRHDAELLGMIDGLLLEAGCTRQDLSGVAVSAGPGSYTGLRIGVSVAKAISEALHLPLISVPSLVAAADAALDSEPTLVTQLEAQPGGEVGTGTTQRDARMGPGLLLAAFPSRKSEVFAAAVHSTRSGLTQVGSTLSGEPEALLAALSEEGHAVLAAVGPAADRFDGLLPVYRTECSALSVARRGRQLQNQGSFVDGELFEPYYLKEFVAGIPTKSRFARLPF